MKKTINFTKMSGSGNDFIVIDNRKNVVKNPSIFAKNYCNRRFGVVVDGLLLVEKSRLKQADFRMVYYNCDGSHASFCGNAARCISLFANINKIAKSKMIFESDAGLIIAEVKKDAVVKVKMPTPKDFMLDFNLYVLSKNLQASFVNTGVPHTVIFLEHLRKQGEELTPRDYITDDIENIDVDKFGRAIRFHKKFQPDGTNVNFVKILDKNKLQVRTYERGVEAETLACGTGVVASSVISIMKGYVLSPVSILTQGGETLSVYYDGKTAFFEGKVAVVFEGKLPINTNNDSF